MRSICQWAQEGQIAFRVSGTCHSYTQLRESEYRDDDGGSEGVVSGKGIHGVSPVFSGKGPLHPDKSPFPHSSGLGSLRHGRKLPATAGPMAPGLGGSLTGHA